MQDKSKPNSYLNQRTLVTEPNETSGVQTEVLTQATVKITADIAAFANPYSILTNEFSSAKLRAVEVSFVIDPAELSKNTVKLPSIKLEVKPIEEQKTEIKEKSQTKEKEYKIPQESATKPEAPQMSDMEILNRLAQYQSAPEQKSQVPEEIFEVPKDAEFTVKPQEETNDLQVLNELQSEETENKKSKTTKEEISSAMNGLEGLLAELSDDEDHKDLGMG